MSLLVAVGNVIYYASTGESLPSPHSTRRPGVGRHEDVGTAMILTVGMLFFAGFCFWMHRRQVRKDQETKTRS
jgi:hypothetical protein